MIIIGMCSAIKTPPPPTSHNSPEELFISVSALSLPLPLPLPLFDSSHCVNTDHMKKTQKRAAGQQSQEKIRFLQLLLFPIAAK